MQRHKPSDAAQAALERSMMNVMLKEMRPCLIAWRNEAQVKAAYMSATGKEQDESDAF